MIYIFYMYLIWPLIRKMLRTIIILTTMLNLTSVFAVPASKTTQVKEDTEEADGDIYDPYIYPGDCTPMGEECTPATDDCCEPLKCISNTPRNTCSNPMLTIVPPHCCM